MNDWPKDDDIRVASELHVSEAAERMRQTQLGYVARAIRPPTELEIAYYQKALDKAVEHVTWLRIKLFQLDKAERELKEKYKP